MNTSPVRHKKATNKTNKQKKPHTDINQNKTEGEGERNGEKEKINSPNIIKYTLTDATNEKAALAADFELVFVAHEI